METTSEHIVRYAQVENTSQLLYRFVFLCGSSFVVALNKVLSDEQLQGISGVRVSLTEDDSGHSQMRIIG